MRLAQQKEEDARLKQNILLVNKLKFKKIRGAIIKELGNRGYVVQGENAQKFETRWSKGELFYYLTVFYSRKKVEFRLVKSDENDDEVDSDTGVRKLDQRYVTYMTRLRTSLSKNLNP